jgi:hypothetical protein
MYGSGYENCPEFGVLGGIIFKLDILKTGRKVFFGRVRSLRPPLLLAVTYCVCSVSYY